MAHSKHTRLIVESESPISNGLTTVAAQKMHGQFGKSQSSRITATYVGPRLDFCFEEFDMVERSICQLGVVIGFSVERLDVLDNESKLDKAHWSIQSRTHCSLIEW